MARSPSTRSSRLPRTSRRPTPPSKRTSSATPLPIAPGRAWRAPPARQAPKQIIRKPATERAITIDPTLRQVFVEVEPHRLGQRRGDWERLQEALYREWGFTGLRIDLQALRRLGPALREGKQQITAIVWNDREVIDVRPGYHEGLYGLAVDVG